MQFPTTLTILALLTPLIAAAPLASTVRVQLNGLDELAIQKEIPINNKATSFAGKFTDGFITNLNGNSGVTCQAYLDAAATKKVGDRFGTDRVVFNGGKEVEVAVVKCSK
jgi:hypothetical protein